MKSKPVRVRKSLDRPLPLFPGDQLMTERLLKKIQDMREEEKGVQSERELFTSKGAILSSMRWKTANLNHRP